MTSVNRVVVKGENPDGEVWSFSLAMAQAWSGGYRGTNDPDVLQDLADGLAALNSGVLIETYFLGYWAPVTMLSGVRVEYWDAAGHVTGAGEHTWTTPVAGTGTAGCPPQTAVVVTLNQGARYTRSTRGRFYLPLTASGIIGSNLQLSSTITAAAVSNAKIWIGKVQALFNSVAGGGDANWYPGVYSRKLLGFTELGSLSVGSVTDTQRRRRDGLIERRSIVSYP